MCTYLFAFFGLFYVCRAFSADDDPHFLSVRAEQAVSFSHDPAKLLADLEQLGHVTGLDNDAIALRADRLEEALRPIFMIAPKDATGNVDSTAARYVLHRLFVHRHGWHVNGIELQGAIRNSSKIGEALHSGGSFSLRQLANFAATLETLVHAENMVRLQRAFDVYKFKRDKVKTDEDAKKVIEAYMMMFVMSYLNPADPPNYLIIKDVVEKAYPGWNDTKHFAENVRRNIFEVSEHGVPLSLWDYCLQVVEEIAERYGRWQNKDCLTLKAKLLELEIPDSGRVPLDAFWAPMLEDSTWLFHENRAYLEQLGALEGNEPPHEYVVIPNYIYSAANCVAGSRYYDVCCINECESLLGQIEERVGASGVPPQFLAHLVANIQSSTVSAPRELQPSLVNRIHEIAQHHGGLVPLHGRLFAQFMHHAFPHECPYPILSSREYMSEKDYIPVGSKRATVTRATVVAYLETLAKVRSNAQRTSGELPWRTDEELFMQNVWLDGREGHSAEADIDADAGLNSSHLALWIVMMAMFFLLRSAIGSALGLMPPASRKPCTV